MKQKWHCGRPCTFAYCQLGETVELHWVRFSNDCSEGDALCSGLALLAGCLRPLTRRVAHHISLAVICCHESWDCRHECKTPNCRKNRKICEVFKEQCYTLLPCLTRFEIQGFYCFILLYFLATSSPRPNDQRSHFSDTTAACDEAFLSPSNRERKYELHGCLSFRRHGTYQFTPCLSQRFHNASRKQLRKGWSWPCMLELNPGVEAFAKTVR